MRPFPPQRVPTGLARGAGAAAVGASVTTALLLGLADYVVRRMTMPRSRIRLQFHAYSPWDLGLTWLDVAIPTKETALAGWFLPQPDETAPALILLPGHASNKGELLGIGRYLWQAGFACLLFDYRGAGNSGDVLSTLGYRETDDTLAAVAWLAEFRPEAPIGLLGYSMGASTAILAAARDPRIGAVVADSGFTSQRELIDYQVRRVLRVPVAPAAVVAAADRLLRRRQGFQLAAVDPRAEIHRIAPRPIFIIHGELDTVVPVAHAHELYEAGGVPKRRWIVDGAPHIGGYFVDRARYCDTVATFFTEGLRSSASAARTDAAAAG